MYLIERPILGDMLPQLQHFKMYQYHRLEKVSVSFLTVFLSLLSRESSKNGSVKAIFLSCCYFCGFFSLFFHWHPDIAEH